MLAMRSMRWSSASSAVEPPRIVTVGSSGLPRASKLSARRKTRPLLPPLARLGAAVAVASGAGVCIRESSTRAACGKSRCTSLT